MVYFIECEGYLKVGYTSNMKRRFRCYVTENPFPCKVIAVIKGGYALEKKIHKQLDIWKHRGEWFHYTNPCKVEVRDIIKENANNEEVKEKKRVQRKRKVKSKTISLKAKPLKVTCKEISKDLN